MSINRRSFWREKETTVKIPQIPMNRLRSVTIKLTLRIVEQTVGFLVSLFFTSFSTARYNEPLMGTHKDTSEAV